MDVHLSQQPHLPRAGGDGSKRGLHPLEPQREGTIRPGVDGITYHGRFRVGVQSLETPVRIVASMLGGRKGVLLLHASGALFDGKAVVFTAISGGGKTTTLSLLSDRTPLSDEVVALSRAASGWTAWATPLPDKMCTPSPPKARLRLSASSKKAPSIT